VRKGERKEKEKEKKGGRINPLLRNLEDADGDKGCHKSIDLLSRDYNCDSTAIRLYDTTTTKN